MGNALSIFKNSEFGEIRTVVVGKEVKFVATDVAKALGYEKPNNAINQHCRYTLKHRVPHPQSPDKMIEVNVITEGDIYRLTARSELPSAQKFESWVFDEVLPSIRKTGTYSTSRENQGSEERRMMDAITRNRNSKIREAKLLMELSSEYMHIIGKESQKTLIAYAIETLTGKQLVSLPEVDKQYTATEIEKELGISVQKFGRLSEQHNLKTEECGIWVLDKSRSSSKQVSSFRYNEKGKNKALELFSGVLV